MQYKLKNCQLDLTGASLLEQIFAIRGFTPEYTFKYLNTTDEDIIDPLALDNMQTGAIMLISAIKNNKKTFLQVDDDFDGFSSAALLINYLYKLFPAYVTNCLTYGMHDNKGHGIELDAVPIGTKFVIIPDAGSSQFDEHKQLKENGIDVLVIDHHNAPEESKDACVINNQLCNYSNKSLSGVGIVYKFCSYIDSLLNVNYADNLLDLAAMGMIADVMDLRPLETKHLITKGLSNINNPFLKAITEKQSFMIAKHGDLDPFAVGFYIAPLVNAVTRIGTPQEKKILFESMLEYRAYELVPSTKRGESGQQEMIVTQACRMCSNVKNKQTELRDTNVAIIKNLIEKYNLLDNKILVVCLSKEFGVNKNLTGLIANMLMSEYQRPVLLLNETHRDGTYYWEGSGRGYEKSALTDFRQFLEDCPLVEYAQGHANAFGACISNDNLRDFINYANEKLKGIDFSPLYQVDGILQANELKSNDILDIAKHKNIWGQNIEEPLICIENLHITKDKLNLLSRDKNPTLKISSNGIEYIKFKSSEEEFEALYSEEGDIVVTVIGKCSMNVFNSYTTSQIIIEDYEITGRNKYYF